MSIFCMSDRLESLDDIIQVEGIAFMYISSVNRDTLFWYNNIIFFKYLYRIKSKEKRVVSNILYTTLVWFSGSFT